MHRPGVADFETVWTLTRVRAEREGRPVAEPVLLGDQASGLFTVLRMMPTCRILDLGGP